MNADKLLGKIKEKRMTLQEVSKGIGISLSAFRRKIEGTSEFTREEIDNLCKLLDATDSELLAIFFDE